MGIIIRSSPSYKGTSAFDAALQDTYLRNAKQNQHQQASQWQSSQSEQEARMLSWRPTTNSIATTGLRIQDATTESTALVHMHAASVTTIPMEPGHVLQPDLDREHDPRMVVTPLIVPKVENLLRSLGILEKWTHVVAGLRDGFDVGIKSAPRETIIFKNHSSSELDPTFISSYIEGEFANGRYSRAYSQEELEHIIGPFRTSPIGLVPKPHSSKFRMIQDLSYPRNNPQIQSVNAGIDPNEFPTEWGTFDKTAQLILSLPEGSLAATFDISAAYRLTPIRPNQQNALCIWWDNAVRVDRAVMFGMASSAGVFGCVADMLVDIYSHANFGPLLKWVDDFFRHPTPALFMDRGRFHQPYSIIGSSMEHGKATAPSPSAEIYRIRLEPSCSLRELSARETKEDYHPHRAMENLRFHSKCTRCGQFTWKVSSHLMHLSHYPPFSPEHIILCQQFPVAESTFENTSSCCR